LFDEYPCKLIEKIFYPCGDIAFFLRALYHEKMALLCNFCKKSVGEDIQVNHTQLDPTMGLLVVGQYLIIFEASLLQNDEDVLFTDLALCSDV
jgi:hypothetical protein